MNRANDECWANSIGGCGGGISHEHYVSKCLFPDESIFVQGFDWCFDKPKPVRIESLTAKILCKDHNSALSEVDAAAGRAFAAIKDYVSTTNQRNEMPYFNWVFRQFEIDGPKLERWFLKTLLNISFRGKLIVGPGVHRSGTIPIDLVRIAFALDEFSSWRGMYTAFQEKETFNLEPRVRFVAKALGPNLAMGNFSFYGFRFYLNLFPAAAELNAIEDSGVFYRRTHFAHSRADGRLSHRLSIGWPPTSPDC